MASLRTLWESSTSWNQTSDRCEDGSMMVACTIWLAPSSSSSLAKLLKLLLRRKPYFLLACIKVSLAMRGRQQGRDAYVAVQGLRLRRTAMASGTSRRKGLAQQREVSSALARTWQHGWRICRACRGTI